MKKKTVAICETTAFFIMIKRTNFLSIEMPVLVGARPCVHACQHMQIHALRFKYLSIIQLPDLLSTTSQFNIRSFSCHLATSI